MKLATLFCALAASAAAAVTPPSPVYVVHPLDLPRDYQGVTVRIALTVDAEGVPHDIAAAQPLPRSLTAQLFPALAAWRFSPGRVNRVPRSTRVILPLCLVPGRTQPTFLPDPSTLLAAEFPAANVAGGR